MLRPQRSTFTAVAALAALSLVPSLALANAGEPAAPRAGGVEDTDFEELDEPPAEAEALPFDRVDLSELEAAAHAPPADRVTVDAEPAMNPAGVADPFPDRFGRTLPRDVWIPGALGVGLAGSAVLMSRLALLPNCSSQDDITSCDAPTDGDLGVGGARVFGAVGLSAGGAVSGAIAGHAFGEWLSQTPRYSLAQKRRIAIGTGTTAVVLGSVGLAAGAGLLGSGARQAAVIGREFEGVDTSALSDAEFRRLNEGLDEVKQARAGFMVLVAAPTLLASGIAVLAHRPRESRLSITPAVSPSQAGMSVRARF